MLNVPSGITERQWKKLLLYYDNEEEAKYTAKVVTWYNLNNYTEDAAVERVIMMYSKKVGNKNE